MQPRKDIRPPGCADCADGVEPPFEFSFAFQPIVNAATGEVFAQEALVRGPAGEPAQTVFAKVDHGNRYRFDQSCRVEAIRLAAELGIESLLSINLMPNAVYRPELCIRSTLAAAERYGFPLDRIIFEITESERISDPDHVKRIVDHYKRCGFSIALDDFGSGYSGLNLLAEMDTDILKLDMELVRNIDANRARQVIVKGILQVCKELSITVVAEGVETREELRALRALGVELIQGFLIAKPAFRSLAPVSASLDALP